MDRGDKCPCCDGTGKMSNEVVCVRCGSPLGWHTAHGLRCSKLVRGTLTLIEGTFAAPIASPPAGSETEGETT